jgi:uncharacterized membrane protein
LKPYVLTVIAPLTIVLASIPMILRRIPRNYFYGFRTERTLASDETWYASNRMAGIAFACAGSAWLIAGLAFPFVMPAAEARVWVLSVGLGAIAAATAVSFLFLRRLPR